MPSAWDIRFAGAGVGLMATLAAGCATSRTTTPAHAADTERTMIELRAQNAGYLRQIEELQNRLFILEDRLDARPDARPDVRPDVRRVAARDADHVTEEPPGEEEDTAVEYAGEAALPDKRGKTRPLLRLAGNGAPRVTNVAAAPSRDPVAPAEKLAARQPALAPASTTTAAGLPTSNEPLRLYRQSLDALRAGRHAAALAGFRKFLARFPRHDYDDNAQYWIGECYYDLKQYKAAVREFRRVVDRYPHGNKVPDAMLKMGFAHLAMGDRRDGRQDLESLRRTFPRHAAAHLAMERLAQPDDRAPPTVTLEMTGR